jgi:hypothetical protein
VTVRAQCVSFMQYLIDRNMVNQSDGSIILSSAINEGVANWLAQWLTSRGFDPYPWDDPTNIAPIGAWKTTSDRYGRSPMERARWLAFTSRPQLSDAFARGYRHFELRYQQWCRCIGQSSTLAFDVVAIIFDFCGRLL